MEDHLRGDRGDGARDYELAGEETPLAESTAIKAEIKFTWRSAFKHKALFFQATGGVNGTLGFRILWYLYAADIWFGNFPLLKFIVGINILIWLVWLWKTV